MGGKTLFRFFGWVGGWETYLTKACEGNRSKGGGGGGDKGEEEEVAHVETEAVEWAGGWVGGCRWVGRWWVEEGGGGTRARRRK